MKYILRSFLLFLTLNAFGQQDVEYQLNFEHADQHEARITATFDDLKNRPLNLSMSRSSPGRYALHEFAKNVYNLKAFDSNGRELKVNRVNTSNWEVPGHDGRVTISYTLFANRADGTYSDISESHAHLNIPATLIYAPQLKERTHRLNFDLRADLNWRVATQLVKENDSVFTAPDLYYLMDSPVEVSDHAVRSFTIDGPNGEQTIKFALHDTANADAFDIFFEHVKNIVLEEIAVFGEAPNFDHGVYTFLACYLPWVSGDGMEHRNSTVLTSTRSIGAEDGLRNLGTVAHEFFHAWNVERLRPASLEPFDFQRANMSGELWFAEGFTSYYTNLILKRAGIMDEKQYLESITPTFNYVWNSPGRQFFSPVEMSYQAPFVDAATSVDPVNRGNTFISYYSYGHMLGLALDLTLRNSGKSLDGFLKELWAKYGRAEQPYTLKNIQQALASYAGKPMAAQFFESYIYRSEMPDYNGLFNLVGVQTQQSSEKVYLGATVQNGTITNYPLKGSPAEKAGLSKGDVILKINNQAVDSITSGQFTENYRPGKEFTLEVQRFGKVMTKTLILEKDPAYRLKLMPYETGTAKQEREDWLGARRK